MATRSFTGLDFAAFADAGDVFTVRDPTILQPGINFSDVFTAPDVNAPAPTPAPRQGTRLPRVRPGDLITAELCNLLLALTEQLVDQVAALDGRVRSLEQPSDSPRPDAGTAPDQGSVFNQDDPVITTDQPVTDPVLAGDLTTRGAAAALRAGQSFLAMAEPRTDPTTGVTTFTLRPVAASRAEPPSASTETVRPVTEVSGIGDTLAKRLSAAGIADLASLAATAPARVADALDASEERAAGFVDEAARLMKGG